MKNLKLYLEQLKSKYFPTKQDRIWKQWVEFTDRDNKDLINLLSSEVQDNFKQRAIFLLLVPDPNFNIIYWKKEVGRFSYKVDFLNKLTPELLDYAVDLIVNFCSTLKPLHNGIPQNNVLNGGSIKMFWSTPEKYHDALNFYNQCIFSLIKILPEDKAKKVFPLFSLLDISTYWNMDEASGYGPFNHLMYSQEIDEKWKKAADVRMREIITNEVTGKTKPREDWEDALSQYAEILLLCFYSKKPYSIELFASQIQFVIDNKQYKNGLIPSHEVSKLFKILADPQYKNLKHAIARYALLENTKGYSRFFIYDENTQAAVDIMLAEFWKDTELMNKIKELEAERDKKAAESAQRAAEQQSKETENKKIEEDILKQMK